MSASGLYALLSLYRSQSAAPHFSSLERRNNQRGDCGGTQYRNANTSSGKYELNGGGDAGSGSRCQRLGATIDNSSY